MAIKARETITIIKERDINATWRFYRIASSASTPSQPTEAQGKAYVSNQTVPSGWSITEPAYDGTSTNSLYTCDLTSFSDGGVSWSAVSKSSSYEAAKQAYNEAQNAKKVATNYLTDLSNGVYVHADGTPADPANTNAKGVKITDVVDIIRTGQSVGQFGEKIRLGRQDNIHFQIDNNAFGYYVDDVPVSTLTCSYALDGDEDEEYEEVGTKDMELKVVSPVFSNTDKCKASVILHYESGSGKPTYGRLFVQNIDSQLGNMAYVEVREAQADSDVILYSEGTIFKVHGHDKIASLNGSLLVEGMAGMIQMWAGQYAPPGWRICDGSTLGREAFSKLFSAKGAKKAVDNIIGGAYEVEQDINYDFVAATAKVNGMVFGYDLKINNPQHDWILIGGTYYHPTDSGSLKLFYADDKIYVRTNKGNNEEEITKELGGNDYINMKYSSLIFATLFPHVELHPDEISKVFIPKPSKISWNPIGATNVTGGPLGTPLGTPLNMNTTNK